MVVGRKVPIRLLGVDYGMTRIGLALSDESQTIAMPLSLFKAEKKMEQTAHALLSYIEQQEKERSCLIQTLVVGLPLHMNGKISMMADEVTEWTAILRQHTTRLIVLWDERLTSVQADRALREGQLNRKKRAQHVDVTASVLLLQNYLDAQQFRRETAALEDAASLHDEVSSNPSSKPSSKQSDEEK